MLSLCQHISLLGSSVCGGGGGANIDASRMMGSWWQTRRTCLLSIEWNLTCALHVCSLQNLWKKFLQWCVQLSGELHTCVSTWWGRPVVSPEAISIRPWAQGLLLQSLLPEALQVVWWSCWVNPTLRTTTATSPRRSSPGLAGICTTSSITLFGWSRRGWRSTSISSTWAALGLRCSPSMMTFLQWSQPGRTSTACSSQLATPAGRRGTTITWIGLTCCEPTRLRTSGTCCMLGWMPSWWWAMSTGATRLTPNTTQFSTSWRLSVSSPSTRWVLRHFSSLKDSMDILVEVTKVYLSETSTVVLDLNLHLWIIHPRWCPLYRLSLNIFSLICCVS